MDLRPLLSVEWGPDNLANRLEGMDYIFTSVWCNFIDTNMDRVAKRHHPQHIPVLLFMKLYLLGTGIPDQVFKQRHVGTSWVGDSVPFLDAQRLSNIDRHTNAVNTALVPALMLEPDPNQGLGAIYNFVSPVVHLDMSAMCQRQERMARP